jgi:4-amino-4-deoxy-L-arabinose transferase-like glycosyltransferase
MAPYATSPDCTAPISWRLGLMIFLAVLALSIPQAALLPLLDRDEPRFAEASREMWQGGNFVVPIFNGSPRYAKPPFIYWCQSFSFTILGQNAFAARLPSLIATAGTALLLVTWGMRLGRAQAGVGAGLLYAFCLQTVQQGRVATADALLIFFMTMTAFAGWKIIRPKAPGRVPVICFVVLAVGFAGGFLAKGPEALLPIVPLLGCARRTGRGVIAGIVVSFFAGLGLVLFWAIPAYIETNGDYWRVGMSEGVGERMVTGLQGHGATSFGWYLLSVPLYPLLFWLSALPWSPLLIIHRKKLFANWKCDLTDGYLLLNAGVIFVVFSLMVTKLPHYTLPAFPLLALAFARRWETVGLPPCTLTKMGWITGVALALLATMLIPIALANHATPSPTGELVRDAKDVLTPQTEFALVDFQEPNTIWEMRRVVKGEGHAIDDSEVISYLDQSGPRSVLLSTELWDRFRILHSTSQPTWKIFEARGFNAAKGHFIDLTLVVRP